MFLLIRETDKIIVGTAIRRVEPVHPIQVLEIVPELFYPDMIGKQIDTITKRNGIITKITVHESILDDEREWRTVLSHRNKLLGMSDWTQLLDSGLSPGNILEWRAWRYKLKHITRALYPDKNIARKAIANLEAEMPPVEWNPETY